MGLPKIILAATDFSADGKRAAAEAIQLAKKLDARVFLVHAWQMPISTWEGAWAIPQEVFGQVEDAAASVLKEAVDAARAEYPGVDGKLVQGDPREAILQTARELGADLIVVGTHGRRGVSRLLLGSVAEAVVRHAPCSVFVSRKGAST